MREYKTDQLRNVALLSHGHAGKTSLAEAMLFDTGATSRLGRVDDGSTVADFDEEEIRRKMSLSTAVIPCEWKGCKLNVLDTPGYMDFIGEVKGAIRVVESVIIILDAVGGVEVGTELVWGYADERSLPRLVFINKMDRENANFERVLQNLSERFAARFIPIQLPIGKESGFQGVVDLVGMRAYLGSEGKQGDIPAGVEGAIDDYRLQLIEAAAEGDDALIEKYFDQGELTAEEIQRGLKAGVASRTIVPVLCGSATQNIGIQALLDAVALYLPSPLESQPEVAKNPATGEEFPLEVNETGPLAALVWKTMADPYVGKLTYFRVYSGALVSDSRVFNARSGEEERVGQVYYPRGKEQIPASKILAGDIGAVAKLSGVSTGDTLCDKGQPILLAGPQFPKPVFDVAISPKTKADSAKLGATLTRLCEEDPTLHWRQEPSTRQVILSGMGESHVDIAVRRLESKFGVGVETSVPKVPYRETVTKTAVAQYRHKKQTGGAGQFAEVHVRLEPLPRDGGFEYVWEVFGGAISSSFMPSIEKGVRQVMEQGVIAGYPVVDVKLAVIDGKEHPVDSKDIAFQIAGREVFKLAVEKAGPVLLEPIMNLVITVPEQYMGDVLGDLNTKRARVQGMDRQRGWSVVTAQVPLAEIQRYATDLRSITQGRGYFTMTLSHYEEVPAHLAQNIIEAAKREREAEK
ncbi:MAG: elongation factor G [Anaerolineae bacterium]|jgi:elongation factor G|nr:elongation factor G [Anaerolineae bacterium]MDH7473666.1 elongation factor G [Anaerolineae bacterium]